MTTDIIRPSYKKFKVSGYLAQSPYNLTLWATWQLCCYDINLAIFNAK